MKQWSMPFKVDEPRLYACVATIPCQLPTLHGVCGKWPVQVSHSNQEQDGKGGQLRAYPWRVAAICPTCHVRIDSGKLFDKEERRFLWNEAHRSTFGLLFERGLVRPIAKPPPGEHQ